MSREAQSNLCPAGTSLGVADILVKIPEYNELLLAKLDRLCSHLNLPLVSKVEISNDSSSKPAAVDGTLSLAEINSHSSDLLKSSNAMAVTELRDPDLHHYVLDFKREVEVLMQALSEVFMCSKDLSRRGDDNFVLGKLISDSFE